MSQRNPGLIHSGLQLCQPVIIYPGPFWVLLLLFTLYFLPGLVFLFFLNPIEGRCHLLLEVLSGAW